MGIENNIGGSTNDRQSKLDQLEKERKKWEELISKIDLEKTTRVLQEIHLLGTEDEYEEEVEEDEGGEIEIVIWTPETDFEEAREKIVKILFDPNRESNPDYQNLSDWQKEKIAKINIDELYK